MFKSASITAFALIAISSLYLLIDSDVTLADSFIGFLLIFLIVICFAWMVIIYKWKI